VSNYHAYADTCDDLAPASLRPRVDALRHAIATAATRLVAIIEHRLARQRIARLSDHMLRDSGFERDWDGTVRPLRD
jgi:hypothetical protein